MPRTAFSLTPFVIGALFVLSPHVQGADPKSDSQEATVPNDAAAKPLADGDVSREVPPVPDGNVAELQEYIEDLRLFRPASREQLNTLFTRVKAAADRIMELTDDVKSEAYADARDLSLAIGARLIAGYDAEAQKKAFEQYRKYFAEQSVLGRAEASLAMSVATSLESGGNVELAKQAYLAFGEIFSKQEDPRMAQIAEAFLGPARRMDLLGNELKLTGVLLGGKPFDIKSLKGKVVLVDFWATWCGPCRAEHPNMAKCFERFHDQGFEIVGISLDEDRNALEKYVEEHQVPWLTLHDPENNGQHPAATYYGISGIPAMFLVNREGKVVSLHARGDELTRLLEEMLGSKDEKSDE